MLLKFLKREPMGNKSRHLPFKSLFIKSRIPKLPSPSPWPWPSCNNKPKTLSFPLLDETVGNVNYSSGLVSTGSCITTPSSLELESWSTSTSDFSVEEAMQAVSSKRLLFDGGCSDRSLRNVNVVEVGAPLEGSVAVEVESEDPYRDFRVSMKEMVDAEGGEGKDLVWFEEMLERYLRLNKRWTHEFIIAAYWDLLLEMMVASSCSVGDSLSSNCSCCSSSSSSYASCLSEIEELKEVEEGGKS